MARTETLEPDTPAEEPPAPMTAVGYDAGAAVAKARGLRGARYRPGGGGVIQKTKIEWCDYTANPIRYRRDDDPTGQRGSVWACAKASEGCQHCYAETLAKRFQGREFTASAMRGVVPYVDEGELRAMLSPRRLPAGSRCFVGDMTDVFGPWVPFELLDRVFAVMALRPDVVFQVLTKRPERMREYLTDMGRHYMGDVDGEYMERWGDAAVALTGDPCSAGGPIEDCGWPLPNVWLGTSVENQQWADVRIPELLATPAAVRFVSCEPLLGPVDFASRALTTGARLGAIHWVIVGGESGPKARPCDVAWVRSVVSQCRAAGVAVFVKQLGSRPVEIGELSKFDWPNGTSWRADTAGLRDRKGVDPAEWPEDLKVREMPR